MLQMLEVVSAPAIDLSSIDFSQILTMYTTVVGIALPVIITILAAKKGVSWLKGFIAKA